MMGFMRGVGAGAGLAAMGYGMYRCKCAERNWVAPTAIGAGLSLTLAGMAMLTTKKKSPMDQMADMAQEVLRSMPRCARTMMRMAQKQKAPQQKAPRNRARSRSVAMPVFW